MVLKVLCKEEKYLRWNDWLLTVSAGQMTIMITGKGFRSSNGLLLTLSPLCTYAGESHLKTHLISWTGFKFQIRKVTKPAFLDISIKWNHKWTIRNARNGVEQGMRHRPQSPAGRMGLNKPKYISTSGLNCQVSRVGIRCHFKNKIYCLKFLSLEVPKKSLWIRSQFNTFLAPMKFCIWHVYPSRFNSHN